MRVGGIAVSLYINKKPEYVYMALTFIGREKFIKIGRSWNIRLRMTQLKRAYPSLELASYIQCEDQVSSQILETILHRQARKGRYRGEWHPFELLIISNFLRQKGAVICL